MRLEGVGNSERARTFDLGRMTLGELGWAFAAHTAVRTYVVLAIASAGVTVALAPGPAAPLAAAVATVLIYPLVWYALHRFVLHARWMYKSRWTAKLWKRIHFDHHQDPHRLDVLFGALSTTLPVVLIVGGSLGWAIGGLPSAAAAIAAGLAMLCVYEFCHCIQHLNYRPKSAYLRRIKRLHLAHHFHNETGNFGITAFFVDRWAGTLYEDVKQKGPSATVFDLGYDAATARTYPWVAELSGGPPCRSPPRAGS